MVASVTNMLRILLTLPAYVASHEGYFSILKLLNMYLRSKMAQERLVRIYILLMEYEVAEKLGLKLLVCTFAGSKARKSRLNEISSSYII
jgi:hypothetical protein